MAAHVAYYGIRVVGVVGYIVWNSYMNSEEQKDNPQPFKPDGENEGDHPENLMLCDDLPKDYKGPEIESFICPITQEMIR